MTNTIRRSGAEIAQKIDQIRRARKSMSVLSLSPSVQHQRRRLAKLEEDLVAYYDRGSLPLNADSEVVAYLEGNPATELENYGTVEELD